MMLGPASSENEGAGSGTGRVRAFSLVIRACWCWCGGVVSAARARRLPWGVAISAPGRAVVFAGGSRGSGRSIAGCRACPPL